MIMGSFGVRNRFNRVGDNKVKKLPYRDSRYEKFRAIITKNEDTDRKELKLKEKQMRKINHYLLLDSMATDM